MTNIIGRPNGDLLDVMLGDGADPEQAIINGSERRDGSEDDRRGDEPTAPKP